jgi:hypothetical protein
LLIGSTQKSTSDSKGDIPMLKKIVLVGALAVASLLSLTVNARTASAEGPQASDLACQDPWTGEPVQCP